MYPDCLPHQSDCLPHQVRGDVWDVNLPRTIEAFVTSNSGPLDPHLDFLRTYDLSPADVPLLKMGSNIDSPFEPMTVTVEAPTCESWCNQYTCAKAECAGCEICTRDMREICLREICARFARDSQELRIEADLIASDNLRRPFIASLITGA